MDLASDRNRKYSCRLCYENSNDTFDIYSKQGVSLKVGPILNKHFGFLNV